MVWLGEAPSPYPKTLVSFGLGSKIQGCSRSLGLGGRLVRDGHAPRFSRDLFDMPGLTGLEHMRREAELDVTACHSEGRCHSMPQ